MRLWPLRLLMKTVMSAWGWGGSMGRRMVHLLLRLLGYHNHLSGFKFSLVEPLTRAGRKRAGAPLSEQNDKPQNFTH